MKTGEGKEERIESRWKLAVLVVERGAKVEVVVVVVLGSGCMSSGCREGYFGCFMRRLGLASVPWWLRTFGWSCVSLLGQSLTSSCMIAMLKDWTAGQLEEKSVARLVDD